MERVEMETYLLYSALMLFIVLSKQVWWKHWVQKKFAWKKSGAKISWMLGITARVYEVWPSSFFSCETILAIKSVFFMVESPACQSQLSSTRFAPSFKECLRVWLCLAVLHLCKSRQAFLSTLEAFGESVSINKLGGPSRERLNGVNLMADRIHYSTDLLKHFRILPVLKFPMKTARSFILKLCNT